MTEGTERDISPQGESALQKMARGMTEEKGAQRGTYRRAHAEVHRREIQSRSSRAK